MMLGSTNQLQRTMAHFWRGHRWYRAVSMLICVSIVSPFVDALSISAKNSSVAFSGVHAGREFSGEFEQFAGNVTLPNNATDETASISVEFTTSSAVTGDSTYDKTLPKGDWFAVDQFPTAQFESTEMRISSEGYLVVGNLTIKEFTHPVEFELQRQGDRLVSSVSINRLDYKIGYESDPDAEWIDKAIRLNINIPAQ